MGLRIATNLPAIAAQRFMGIQTDNYSKASEKLASGQKINRASDDASGLAIATKMQGQLRSMQQASRNASDGISMIQVAEGALSSLNAILSRMRELSIQAATDTYSDEERFFLSKEFQQLKDEIQRVADTTEFNDRKLLNGTGRAAHIQVGLNHGAMGRIVLEPSLLDSTLTALGLENTSVLKRDDAQNTLDPISAAINKVNEMRSELGAAQNKLNSAFQNLSNYFVNLSSARGQIADTDFAETASDFTRAKIVTEASTAVLTQANQSGSGAIKLLK